jgi:dUTPase
VGLDLSPASGVVLTPEMGTGAIPTGIYGPLPAGSVGWLLGGGCMTMKGLHVFPGVIDSDFQGGNYSHGSYCLHHCYPHSQAKIGAANSNSLSFRLG